MSSPTSTAGRKVAYKSGNALPPASKGAAPGYPVTSGQQWEKARQAVGRVKDAKRRGQLAKLLRKTAPQFGKQKALAQSWAAPGGGSKNMSNVYGFASTDMTCPRCGYSGDNAEFKTSDSGPDSASGTSLGGDRSSLQTPAPSGSQSQAGYSYGSSGMSVRGASSGNLGLANRGGRGIELARRMPVTGAGDILVSRGEGGIAIIRHRVGGATIGTISRTDAGWVATPEGGQGLTPRTHQRASMLDLIGGYNKVAGSPFARPAGPPIQAPPVQTPLMQQYGVPAVRALATPTTSSSGGGRMTDSDNDNDSGSSDGGPGGLSPRGVAIYKKLLAKGFPAARALAFARRAQSGPPGRKAA